MPAQELERYQEVFKEFYLRKYSGRRLVWHNSLGTCMLRAHFNKGQKELSVSLFQTVVLMLFNDVDSLTFAELKEMSGIEDKELRRTLQSLACGKVGRGRAGGQGMWAWVLGGCWGQGRAVPGVWCPQLR